MCEKSDSEKINLAKSVGSPPRAAVAAAARASLDGSGAKQCASPDPKLSDSEVPPKKRKTRRGKSKRKHLHPYQNATGKGNNIVKPEAPYNSNRFLIEDHGDLSSIGIDEEFKKTDQASTSTLARTRDSSFSMDSDGEFYSTPDDEDVFLIKDFDDQYESLQAERLQAMGKDELIREYLSLERRLEILSKRVRSRAAANGQQADAGDKCDALQREVQRLTLENDTLKRENESLRTRLNSSSSDSDSSSDSCSSSGTSSNASSLSRPDSPADYRHTNGHAEDVKSI